MYLQQHPQAPLAGHKQAIRSLGAAVSSTKASSGHTQQVPSSHLESQLYPMAQRGLKGKVSQRLHQKNDDGKEGFMLPPIPLTGGGKVHDGRKHN